MVVLWGVGMVNMKTVVCAIKNCFLGSWYANLLFVHIFVIYLQDGIHTVKKEQKRPDHVIKKMKLEDQNYLAVKTSEESKVLIKQCNTFNYVYYHGVT